MNRLASELFHAKTRRRRGYAKPNQDATTEASKIPTTPQFPLPDSRLAVYSVIARRPLRKTIRATLMATDTTSDSPAPHVTRIWLNRLAPFLGLILVIAIFAILIGDPAHYLSPKNLRTVLAQTVIVAIGAIGMTMIIISGGIDLSVGSTIALTGVITALGINAGWAVSLAIAAGIMSGGIVGVMNGLAITRLRVVPVIAIL